jgi:hypothetical protein
MSSGKPTPSRPALSQYWHADEVPDYVAELCASFRDGNPDFGHRLYSESQAERFIAEHFGSRELAAFRACAVPSMQSDYFRYCAVLARGGIYADVDYRCIAPLRPLVEGCDGGEIFLGPTQWSMNGREANRIWSGFFAFREPGHPFLELALEIATANVEARLAERIWPAGEKAVESIWLTVGPGVPTLMRFIHAWGSFEAFVEGLAGSPMEPFAEPYCETIGDYGRIAEAFEGVRVSSSERMFSWVEDPPHPLPYKDSGAHWKNVTHSIFRP